MYFHFAHNNFNVMDLDKSIRFYEEALDLREVRRNTAPDGSFIIVFMGDQATGHQLELTWLRDWDKDHYDLGDDEFHLAFETDDMEKHTPGTRRWAASALRTRRWAFTSSAIRTITGSRLYRPGNRIAYGSIRNTGNIPKTGQEAAHGVCRGQYLSEKL